MNGELSIESTASRQSTCFAIAAGLHALLLLWNPVLMHSELQKAHDFVTVDIVEQPTPGLAQAPAPEKKMGLMDTLKDMLSKPKTDDLAHVAPTIPTPKAPAQTQPMLKDMSRRVVSAFQPKSASEDLAMANNPSQINTMPKPVGAMPATGPTLTTKTFGGIRTKDLPFEMSGQENLATSGANAIPIAVGNRSAKEALAYSGPALADKKGRTITPMTGLSGSPAETPALGAAPAAIPLQGVGAAGQAPSGPKAPALQNRTGSTGGGLINRALTGGSRVNTSGIEGVSAAHQLETAAVNAGGSKKRTQKGFELEGPLGNRTILHKVIPQYPSWAEEQGIVGSVQLYFTVAPDGSVRSNIQVRRTTGYPALDQLGIDALKQWKFAPLNAADEGKGEWGLITFNFSLSS